MTEIKYIEGSLVGKDYKPNMEFRFSLAVPCVTADNFALLIEHDGLNNANVNSMLRLADEGKAPYCVCVGVYSANLLLPDNSQRIMRMNNYDMFDREYGDFLVYELIPFIKDTYDINISESPDMHMVSGGSSGGISAFTIAWFHWDYFHRVYMSSPSFLAMGRGNEIPYLIRKFETKPLRVYQEHSENEPNDYFGWSRSIDEESREAFIFAKYDFNCKFFSEGWHCCHYRDEGEAYTRNQWIWQDWQTKKIKPLGNSPRVDKVIPFGSKWEASDFFPKKEKNAPEILAKNYQNAVLSNDGQAWYVGDENEDVIYLYLNQTKIALEKRNTHAMLHTIPHQKQKGVIDMAVDKTDRLFVLTEIGIQCVRSFGLIDVILDLPDNTKSLKIAVSDALYVKTEKGIYKRELCKDCITEVEEKRKQISYYD